MGGTELEADSNLHASVALRQGWRLVPREATHLAQFDAADATDSLEVSSATSPRPAQIITAGGLKEAAASLEANVCGQSTSTGSCFGEETICSSQCGDASELGAREAERGRAEEEAYDAHFVVEDFAFNTQEDFVVDHTCRRVGSVVARRCSRPPRISANRLHLTHTRGLHRLTRRGGRGEEGASHKSKPRSSLSRFAEMRQGFRDKYADALRGTFGPQAQLSEAKVSGAVAARFMARLQRYRDREDSMLLAFHGTARENYAGILRKGFLLPGSGPGRVAVAHGNVHGAGIYTACDGHASLSRGYCDSDSMLVCGVIDHLPAEEEEDKDGRKVLQRIGRWPKLPSVCPRLAPQAPAQASRTILGRFEVSKRTSEVLHVGPAMVVFNPSRVVPLFVVNHVPKKLDQTKWRQPAHREAQEEEEEARGVESRVVARTVSPNALWPPDGNPNLASPYEQQQQPSETSRHELLVGRSVQRRRREREHRQARRMKQEGERRFG